MTGRQGHPGPQTRGPTLDCSPVSQTGLSSSKPEADPGTEQDQAANAGPKPTSIDAAAVCLDET